MTTEINMQENNIVDNLDRAEQNEIAGFNSTKPLELAEKHRITLEKELPPEQPIEEKGVPRFLFTATAVGVILFGFCGAWWLIQPKTPSTVAETPAAKEEISEPTPEPDYRGKLALRDQKYALSERSPQPQPTLALSPQPTPTPSPPVRPQPAQRIQAPPPPRMVAQLSPPRRSWQSAIATSKPKAEVDPFKRWNDLAQLGQVRGAIPEFLKQQTKPIALNSSNQIRSTIESKSIPTKTTLDREGIPVINVGFNNSSDSELTTSLTPGARGILNRDRDSDRLNKGDRVREVAFGTTAAGVVSTPLMWDESIDRTEQIQNRFTVTLSENLVSTTGEVALPAGTVIVAEASSVNQENKLVRASAIAIVYKDVKGKTRQQPLEPGAILIQGESNRPLIAKGYFDRGSTIASQDLLISTLSGIGKVGKVFTEPKQTSTFNSGIFGGSSSTVTQNHDPKIWAAVLDGFFSPLSERISERSQAQIEKLANSPNVAVVEPNTKISIFVNSFFHIKN
jgi:hypothetical protein